MAKNIEQDTIEVSSVKAVDMLHSRAVGLMGVLFLTVTGAAPMAAMVGNVPFAAGWGIGIHVPAAFLLATIVLTVFSVGYAAMAAKVSTVGGFYSFISQGLGRKIGMSAGISSLAAYSVFEAALCGLFAFFGNSWIASHLGIDIPWIWLALFMIILIAVLGYRDVRLSAAVLGVALILEVVILAIFTIGVVSAPTGTNFSVAALNLLDVDVPVASQMLGNVAIKEGAAAVGIFMAFWSWVGFEMAPNYAEESRDPKRIVPLSLFISVIGLGIFYAIVSWAAISAYPTEGVMLAKAYSDSGNFFLGPIGQFVGVWARELMAILIMTSAFACGMAFHNTAARYMYSLGREGVIPSALGRTHKTFHSPHVASLTQSGLTALYVILFGAFLGTGDPMAQAYMTVYTMLAILGTGLLLVLQAVVSIAIIAYFRKNGGGNIFTTIAAPIVSFLAQICLVYLLVDNLSTFGASGRFGNNVPWIALSIMAIGLIWGFALKSMKPEAYRRIGHMVNNV